MTGNMKRGFQLRELRLVGSGVPDAVLKFTSGLNVVDGASDTGKSYAVSCIDFVLGAKDLPEEIPQASEYQTACLHIQTNSGADHTLRRALAGGDIGHFKGPLDDALAAISVASDWAILGATSRSKVSLSKLLLGFCGLSGTRIRKNSDGETQDLSFRTLVKSLIVDEQRIIAKRSPLYGMQNTEKTAATNTIRMLLTGNDDKDVIVVREDKKTAAGRLAGKKEVVEAQIDRETEVLETVLKGLTTTGAQMTEMEGSLGALSEVSVVALTELRSAEAIRKVKWEAKRDALNRVGDLDAMLGRAELLEMHYRSDLLRLEAMAESAHLLMHYSEEACRHCGASAEHHQHAPDESPALTIEATAVETRKVSHLTRELTLATKQMRDERQELRERLGTLDDEVVEASKLINKSLVPQMRAAASSLHTFQIEYGRHVRGRELESRLASLRSQLIELEQKPAAREKLKFAKLSTDTMSEVCQQVSELLTRWAMPGNVSVAFDEKTADLIVGNRSRVSHGKGVRAVMCAAYVVGLMQHSFSKQTGHPGFVVIDTPLNPYRPADPSDGGELQEDVKMKFYRDLCATEELGQVIVFENVTPPQEVKGLCHYVHFSGSSSGRRGFIP